jgi:hypothetical protein
MNAIQCVTLRLPLLPSSHFLCPRWSSTFSLQKMPRIKKPMAAAFSMAVLPRANLPAFFPQSRPKNLSKIGLSNKLNDGHEYFIHSIPVVFFFAKANRNGVRGNGSSTKKCRESRLTRMGGNRKEGKM